MFPLKKTLASNTNDPTRFTAFHGIRLSFCDGIVTIEPRLVMPA